MSTKASAPEPTGPVPFLNHPNVIRPFGYSSMECGYCKGARSSVVSKTPKDCSKSFGMLAEAMTPKVYEELVYRGWRRSGIHLYKPSNFESCCPTLTIRLLADQFQPSKSQMKTQRKFRQLLVPPEQRTKSQPVRNNQNNDNNSNSLHTLFESYLNEKTSIITNLVSMVRQALLESNVLPPGLELPSISFKVRPISPRQEKNREMILATSICAQLSGKAKIPRDPLLHSMISYWQKLQPTNTMPIQSVVAHEKSGQILVTVQLSTDQWDEVTKPQDFMTVDLQDNPNDNDKLGDWYREMTGKRLKQGQRKLRIETFPSHQSALEPQVHRLYVQYQHVVHDDPDPFQDQENDTTTTIKNDEGEGESSMLGSIESMIANLDWGPHCPLHFQTHVRTMLKEYLAPHPLHIQRALLNNYYGFYQFLVESPFDTQGDCGTYHQQYWIEDVLIAVGVVDVLPQGLSSVYLYYHPGMAHSLVPLGKLAILEEIEYTRKVLKKPYYYLGYYIESCTKMRYKAEYHPSQLLCPVHYEWIDCHVAIPKLQQNIHHVCALVDDDGDNNSNKNHGAATDGTFSDSILSMIPMDIGAGMAVTMDMLQENGKQVVRPILEEFLVEAGLEIGQQCLVKLT